MQRSAFVDDALQGSGSSSCAGGGSNTLLQSIDDLLADLMARHQRELAAIEQNTRVRLECIRAVTHAVPGASDREHGRQFEPSPSEGTTSTQVAFAVSVGSPQVSCPIGPVGERVAPRGERPVIDMDWFDRLSAYDIPPRLGAPTTTSSADCVEATSTRGPRVRPTSHESLVTQVVIPMGVVLAGSGLLALLIG